jgi:alpha-mannosidase
LVGALSIALLGSAAIRAAEPGQEEQKDMAGGSTGRTLHVVATAHLDTQWLWTIQDTIEKHIPATLHQNFALFEKFPHYVFSFEGAFRYMLMREYYPADFARMKEYVKQGRWQVCGSFVDACDVNVPSPESLVRQILYGNGYFEREFGRGSCDVFLPDCFGFGAALPAVAVHCGLKGFSTQKLTWGSSVGIPFDIGVWEGVGGATLIAALNPGSYTSRIENDLSADPVWQERIAKLGVQAGAPVAYK